jgi:hypothetical protein
VPKEHALATMPTSLPFAFIIVKGAN